MFLFSKDEDSPRLKQLRALSLFSTLSPRELKTADNLLHERSYLQGEVIFDGDAAAADAAPATCMGIISAP